MRTLIEILSMQTLTEFQNFTILIDQVCHNFVNIIHRANFVAVRWLIDLYS